MATVGGGEGDRSPGERRSAKIARGRGFVRFTRPLGDAGVEEATDLRIEFGRETRPSEVGQRTKVEGGSPFLLAIESLEKVVDRSVSELVGFGLENFQSTERRRARRFRGIRPLGEPARRVVARSRFVRRNLRVEGQATRLQGQDEPGAETD